MSIKQEIFKRLQALTKQKFDENSSIYEIGIDSLDLIELVTEAEEHFEVRISDEELEQLKTVKDIIDAFERTKKKS